jgi:short-subunit dehydrogenase
MAIDLTAKPIAITGGSSGIGAATALACARAGMPVAIGARRADKLAEVVRAITHAGGRAVAVTMDVRRPEDNRRLIETTVEAFGSIYSVFANAGYGAEAAVARMSEAEIRDMFECNFFGSLSLARAVIPHLEKNPPPLRGHILLCSSCLAKMTLPYYSIYSATKAAQAHIGRAMNLELEPRSIRVSTVHPVTTRTEFFDQVKARSGGAELANHSLRLFVQSPERVASAIVRCLRRPRPEVWTSLPTRLGMAACTAFPGIEDWFLRRIVRKREAEAGPR